MPEIGQTTLLSILQCEAEAAKVDITANYQKLEERCPGRVQIQTGSLFGLKGGLGSLSGDLQLMECRSVTAGETLVFHCPTVHSRAVNEERKMAFPFFLCISDVYPLAVAKLIRQVEPCPHPQQHLRHL